MATGGPSGRPSESGFFSIMNRKQPLVYEEWMGRSPICKSEIEVGCSHGGIGLGASPSAIAISGHQGDAICMRPVDPNQRPLSAATYQAPCELSSYEPAS